MSPEEEIGRGHEARQLIEHPLLKDAVNQVSEALLAGMRNAAIVDDRLRLRLLDRYELLQSVMQCLKSTMETGQLAQKQLDLEAERRSWMEKLKERVF